MEIEESRDRGEWRYRTVEIMESGDRGEWR